MFVCISCKQGLMDPIRDDEEPDYTDRYRCGNCGHTTTIASRLIVFTQVLSAVLGGAVTFHLLIHHLGSGLAALQFGQNQTVTLNLVLAGLAGILLAGFGYTLFRAFHNVYKRQRYLHNGRQG